MKLIEILGGRKFTLTLLIMLFSLVAPAVYKKLEVSDSITMMVLGIFGGVGVAYGAVNVAATKAHGVVEKKEGGSDVSV